MYGDETKMQSSQWTGKGSPRPKKARMSQSKSKVVMVVFLHWKGIVNHEFEPRGQMVNKQLYQEVLACLRDTVRRTVGKPDLDVAPRRDGSRVVPHPQLSGRKNQTSVALHPPYSPDVAPADFFLFSKLKNTLKGRPFQTTKEMQENAIRELDVFQEVFQQCKKFWEWFIASRGDYFEVDSA